MGRRVCVYSNESKLSFPRVLPQNEHHWNSETEYTRPLFYALLRSRKSGRK